MRFTKFFILGFSALLLGALLHYGIDSLSGRQIAIIPQASVSSIFDTKEKSDGITLVFVGDIMLGRGVGYQVKKHGGDPRYPFLEIASTTKSADIAFANLEGPISSRGTNQGSEYSFRFDPSVIAGLKFADFDVLSVANNHIWDWGVDALVDTVNILKASGIEPIGAGMNYEDANAPKILNVNGTRIAFLGYTTLLPRILSATDDRAGISDFNIEKIKTRIYDARSQADIVVVSLHWGEEYQTSVRSTGSGQANSPQENIAYALIDAGADLIIGHHPHVLQDFEKYKGGWIAYSLGNFVFDQNFSEETMRGGLLRVKIQDRRISDVRLEKVRISDTFQPYVQ